MLFGPTGSVCYVLREKLLRQKKNGMVLSKTKRRSEMDNSTVIHATM